jgi:hypothetical protein
MSRSSSWRTPMPSSKAPWTTPRASPPRGSPPSPRCRPCRGRWRCRTRRICRRR